VGGRSGADAGLEPRTYRLQDSPSLLTMADGRLGQLPRVLVLQAMAAVRRADWNVALPAIDEARRVATETRQVIWAGAADTIAGLAAAMRGEEDQAEGLAADAERVVSPLGVTFVLVTVQMARGQRLVCWAPRRRGGAPAAAVHGRRSRLPLDDEVVGAGGSRRGRRPSPPARTGRAPDYEV
jgi:hypothetical protein